MNLGWDLAQAPVQRQTAEAADVAHLVEQRVHQRRRLRATLTPEDAVAGPDVRTQVGHPRGGTQYDRSSPSTLWAR